MKLIQYRVDPGAEMLVASDGWAAYSGISAAGYEHSVVFQSLSLRTVKVTQPTLSSRHGRSSRDGLTKCTACKRKAMKGIWMSLCIGIKFAKGAATNA